MKPSEFRKILKPLVKQTIREVLFEEGVLSNIVSEVVSGIANQQVMVEARDVKQEDQRSREKYEKQRQDRIRRLNESSKLGSAFEGTKEIVDSSGHGPLANVQSNDRGVDISAIEKIANGKWKHLI